MQSSSFKRDLFRRSVEGIFLKLSLSMRFKQTMQLCQLIIFKLELILLSFSVRELDLRLMGKVRSIKEI